MATNLALNENLLNEALIIGGLKTKKDTVNLALQEFIQRRQAQSIIDAFGTIEFDSDYDYKAGRQRKS